MPGLTPSPTLATVRGAVRRCPRCGGGHLFDSWFKLKERCPTCAMRFEREEGFWLGGYVINFALGEGALLVLLAVLIGLASNHSHISPLPFVVSGLVIAVGGPMLTFPISRTLWCAVYLVMKPLSPEEELEARSIVATSAMRQVPAEGDAKGDEA